jgi:predicted negative regulator of RcsB-dependent stress response
VTRLARVLAAGKRYDAALALLGNENSPGFVPTVEELKGDIYQAQGRIADAQKAYLAASAALRARGEQSPILDLKMADVCVAAPAATPPAGAAEEESTSS